MSLFDTSVLVELLRMKPVGRERRLVILCHLQNTSGATGGLRNASQRCTVEVNGLPVELLVYRSGGIATAPPPVSQCWYVGSQAHCVYEGRGVVCVFTVSSLGIPLCSRL